MVNKLKTLSDIIYFIFHPSWWVMNEDFSKEMDNIMNYLLDNFEFDGVGERTAYLNGVRIWIANVPYATMCLDAESDRCRASRFTIKKGLSKLDAFRINELKATRDSIVSEVKKQYERQNPISTIL